MPSRSLKYLVLCAPLFLAACGEGWEMVRVTNIVPYGNSRTAGSGVAYVRAKLLPEKDLKIAPATASEQTTVVAPAAAEPLKSAEPVFEKKQQK